MKRHKKIIGVGFLLILVISIGIFKYADDVSAVKSVPACENTAEGEIALSNWFNIDAKFSKKNKTITISCDDGEFKMTGYTDPRGNIANDLSKNSDGYVTLNGNELVIGGSKNSKIVLNVNETLNSDNDPLEFKFELTNGGKTSCMANKAFNAIKDTKEGRGKTTYVPGELEVDIPNFAAADKVYTETNNNYNGVCRAIREGIDPTNTVDKGKLGLWDSSADAKDFYQLFVDDCWSVNVETNYEAKTIASSIELALTKWNTIKNTTEVEEKENAWSINFNNVKQAAISKGHSYYYDNESKKLYKSASNRTEVGEITLPCNYKAKSSNDFSNLDLYKKNSDGSYQLDSDGKKIYNIDANVNYYYALSETYEQVTYKYNYTTVNNGKSSNEKTVEEHENVCKRTCEEAVEVKYGPPIASKAGLCFEYQIQVTSRVKCSSEVDNSKKPKKKKLCNPVPYCNNIPGKVHQGGSNEEFDACINSCDGGKYTESCSNKCYKKVYGSSKSVGQVSFDFDFDPTVEKLRAMKGQSGYDFPGYEGRYNYSNGKISWSNEGTYARYYHDNEDARTRKDDMNPARPYSAVRGFKRHYLGNGEYCHDKCYFSIDEEKCLPNSYLNSEERDRDLKANKEAFANAVEKCKAGATCTTKTANFKISVDYIEKVGEEPKTINFPISSAGGNNLKTDEKEDTCTSNPELGKDNNILLNYGGCYESCGNGRQYHTRWSFPGTWINNKTGEIVYKNPGSGSAWKKQENKFCIPLNAKNVNPNWWNYYFNHVNSTAEKAGTKTSVTSSEFEDVCLKNSKSTGTTITNATSAPSSSSITWNINGSTTNFGYFGWKFKFRCFYALNSNPANVNTSSSSDKTVKEKCVNDTPSTDYRIRSVDLKNLFPSTDGTEISTADSVGRQPGFNWTQYATNVKNPAYISQPLVYVNEVQALGYNVYKDNTLDYEFYLTPYLMKTMRDENKKYGTFTGESKQVSTGIVAYKSDLWRDSGKLAGNSTKVAKDRVLGCNNIDNYQSIKCK